MIKKYYTYIDIINIVNINVHDVNYFAIKVSIDINSDQTNKVHSHNKMCESCKMNTYSDM